LRVIAVIAIGIGPSPARAGIADLVHASSSTSRLIRRVRFRADAGGGPIRPAEVRSGLIVPKCLTT